MKTFETLPRDGNGIIIGQWRVVHRRPSFEGSVGAVNFKKGRADKPMTGRALAKFMASMAPEVIAEPWDLAAMAVDVPAEKKPQPPLRQLERLPPGTTPPTEGQVEKARLDAQRQQAQAFVERTTATQEQGPDLHLTPAPAPAPEKAPQKPPKKRGKKKGKERVERDELDDIDNDDILRAMADGLGVRTSFGGKASLRAAIRKARKGS